MKLLFITEKYCAGPQFGMTNSITNLIGSYEASEFGTYEHYFIDQEDIFTDEGIDQLLLEKEYDLAFISSFAGRNASLNCVKTLKELNKKVTMCWWDSIMLPKGIAVPSPAYKWWEFAEYCPQIMFDAGNGEENTNAFSLAVPQDTRLFTREKNEDIFELGFAGTLRPDRLAYVNFLRQNGINVIARGGRGPEADKHNISFEEYASILNKSKICLNCSLGHGSTQRKGRAFEIGAVGRFMLSDYPETFNGKDGYLFENGKHFIAFGGYEDLLFQVRYYLKHEEEREEIASNLYEHYMKNYSPKPFWKKVFNICKI